MSLRPREERKLRLGLLIRKLKEAPQSNLRQIIAWGCLEWGVSKNVMKDYLSLMQDAGKISIDEDDDGGDGIIFWEKKE